MVVVPEAVVRGEFRFMCYLRSGGAKEQRSGSDTIKTPVGERNRGMQPGNGGGRLGGNRLTVTANAYDESRNVFPRLPFFPGLSGLSEEKMPEMKFAKFAPVESLQATAYVVGRCDELCIALNITKLQKLLYCCYGTVLGKFGLRLVDEYPVAGPYGPVFPAALRSLQFFGIDAFRGKAAPETEGLPEAVRSVIDETLENFGKFGAEALSRWTRMAGSPWYRVTKGGSSPYRTLRDEDIRNYFRAYVLL